MYNVTAIHNILGRTVQKQQRLVTDLQVDCSRRLLSSWIGAEHSRGMTTEPANYNTVQKNNHSANHKGQSTIRRRTVKTKGSLWQRIKCFASTLRRGNLNTQQSPFILDLCLRKTRTEKSHYCADAILFDKLCFQNISVHMKTHCWRFQILPVWRAPFSWRISVDGGLTREIKLRFRDGLVWTVGQIVEVKLRFPIPPV